jgi:hypothetical protein
MKFKLRPWFLISVEIVFFIVVATKTTKSAIFWDVMPCNLVEVYHCISEQHAATSSVSKSRTRKEQQAK